MVVDRIERHDVFNAIMLAAVLLLLGFGLLTALGRLASTVDEGLVTSTKEPELESEELALGATSTTVAEEDTEVAEDLVDARPPGEVMVRVANGARRPGVAGAGTETVAAAGYPTLDPKNGPTTDDSVIYYAVGYAADAVKIAQVLGVDPERIEPMPDDPGVDIDGAHIIALLGVNSNF